MNFSRACVNTQIVQKTVHFNLSTFVSTSTNEKRELRQIGWNFHRENLRSGVELKYGRNGRYPKGVVAQLYPFNDILIAAFMSNYAVNLNTRKKTNKMSINLSNSIDGFAIESNSRIKYSLVLKIYITIDLDSTAWPKFCYFASVHCNLHHNKILHQHYES